MFVGGPVALWLHSANERGCQARIRRFKFQASYPDQRVIVRSAVLLYIGSIELYGRMSPVPAAYLCNEKINVLLKD